MPSFGDKKSLICFYTIVFKSCTSTRTTPTPVLVYNQVNETFYEVIPCNPANSSFLTSSQKLLIEWTLLSKQPSKAFALRIHTRFKNPTYTLCFSNESRLTTQLTFSAFHTKTFLSAASIQFGSYPFIHASTSYHTK